MSIWQRYSIESRVREILGSAPPDRHHFGRAFLSPYQIAIEFEQLHRQDARLIGKLVGGKDTGTHDSLAKYVANQLSRRIRDGSLADIEGRHLSGRYLDSLKYDNQGATVASSLGRDDMSIFRLSST